MWSYWENRHDLDFEFDDIFSGNIIQEAIMNNIFCPGDVLFLGNKDGCGAFKKKYSVTPSLFQLLNPDQLNRVNPFWMILSSLIPGPKKFKNEDIFLKIEQVEFRMLNNGIISFISSIFILNNTY